MNWSIYVNIFMTFGLLSFWLAMIIVVAKSVFSLVSKTTLFIAMCVLTLETAALALHLYRWLEYFKGGLL